MYNYLLVFLWTVGCFCCRMCLLGTAFFYVLLKQGLLFRVIWGKVKETIVLRRAIVSLWVIICFSFYKYYSVNFMQNNLHNFALVIHPALRFSYQIDRKLVLSNSRSFCNKIETSLSS